MMKLKPLTYLSYLLAAVLLATSLAGCSQITPASTNYDTGSKTLDLWDSGPLTLDPAISSEMSSHLYVMQLYSGLVKFDSQLKPAPDIAERWEVSADGKTFTFFLRRDVKFHDGRLLTAADIKYSFERTCNPATNSPTALTYLGDINGVADVISGKAKSISGIEVVNDNTIKISINAPKAYFLSKMAYPTAFVVDRKNVEAGPGWWKKPNGTGPYKLQQWDTGNLIIIEPNNYYYGEKASVRVAFHLLSGAQILMSLYETGKIDVLEVNRLTIDKASDPAGPYYSQLKIFPQFMLRYIGFNTSKPPFDDVYVRQAFCHAVDKEKIIRLTQKGMVTPATGIIPEGMPGYNKDIKGLDYNVAKAKELLAKSKYGSAANLPAITLTDSSLGGIGIDHYMGAILQDWKRDLGVNVTVRFLNIQAFQYNLRQEGDEMFAMGWVADYPDPQNFLDILFHSGADYNNSNFSSKELDELLDRAAVEKDYDKRISLYQQAEQLVVDQAPVLPLWFDRNYVLVSPRVQGFTIDPLGVPRFNQITLEK
jgi:oligopeptide transport system substrate-binding protein